MKIGILTHYNVNNQGAQLQMYALYNYLKEMGHIPKILTYNKNFDFEQENKLRFQTSIRSVPYYLNNYLFKRGIGSTMHNIRKLSANKKFRKSYFDFENYIDADIDLAIVGSDEVFSIEMGINIMMYGHGVNTDKIISYAPSFGQTDMTRIEKYHCKELIQSGLLQFKNISARDIHTANIIEKITGRKATIVCDPVLLYNFVNVKEKFKHPNKKYMVVYAYDHNMQNENEIKSIKQYARKHNLLIVSPGTYHKWCDLNVPCDILEWFNWFRYAECVVTDTFHGTITAIINNIPMAVMVRKKTNVNKMLDLLNRTDLINRKLDEISENELEKIFSSKINFKTVEQRLSVLRNEASKYLETAINS